MTSVAKVIFFCALGASLAGASVQKDAITPVTRVVQLLKALLGQVEKEGKVEEGLYEDFVCWGKSIINQKLASNAEARTRIDSLATYIADMNAGRVEFTSERADLEKDIAELMNDMEEAKAMRDQDNADFETAADEMVAALRALDDALETLYQATKDHKEGVLLAVRASLDGAAENGGMEKLVQRQALARQAVKLGEKFLEKADATFLRRVLLGEVPEVPKKAEWKKLNRTATFKSSYKARSFKIMAVLQKMRDTFKLNLKEAEYKESNATADFKKLYDSKKSQLNTARTALTNQDTENGQKGMSIEESQEEKDLLTKQVADDEKFIEDTENALEKKKESWKIRQDVRSSELAAISKAIAILTDNESRDVFTKSFKSQENFGFLQVSRTSSKATMSREKTAAASLKKAAVLSGDKRLLALASSIEKQPSVKSKFRPILRQITQMISFLQEEEEKDLAEKQICEDDRMYNTREAIKTSRRMDERTEEITRLASVVKQREEKIKELQQEIDKINAAIEEAKIARNREHEDWKVNNEDDKKAAAVVKEASHVLATWYNNQMKEMNSFLQKGKQPVSDMAAGEAPPPPPPTWEGGYASKQGEAQGIVAIMDMIYEDILKDRQDAEDDDKTSEKEFQNFATTSKKMITKLKTAMGKATSALGSAAGDKTDEEKERSSEGKYLRGMLDFIKDINPNCEYYMVNYDLRQKNRHIERDALSNAAAILQNGATFDRPDPSREIKPGDAAALFLQTRSSA